MSAFSPIQDPAAARAFLEIVGETTHRRGQRYFSKGAVRSLQCVKPGIEYTAKVQGSQLYTTQVLYEKGEWFSNCSCPIIEDCKHAVAVILALLNHAAEVDKIIPVDFRSRATAKAVPLDVAASTALNRALRPEERLFVKRVQQVYRDCRHAQCLTPYQLRQLFPRLRLHQWEALDLWPRFPADEVEFWQYLAGWLRHWGTIPPEFLAGIADSERIDRLVAERQRQQQIQLWQHQLETQSRMEALTPVEAQVLEFRLLVGVEKLIVEARPEGAGDFQPVKSNRLRQLTETYKIGNLSVVPATLAVWQALCDLWARTYRIELNVHDAEVQRTLNILFRLPGLEARVATADGTPFVRVAEPLRWQAELVGATGDDYEISLVTAAGTRPTDLRFSLPGRPTLYVTATEIYCGPAPWKPIGGSQQSAVIPAPVLESAAGLELLHRLGVELPAALQARVRHSTLQVKFQCDLKPAYPGADHDVLAVTATAGAETGARQESFTVAGWREEDTPSAPSATGVCLYDRSALAAVPALIASLGVKWNNYDQCWYRRITKNFPELFAHWLATLPSSITVALDKQLASLQQAPIAATVRLDCESAGVDWFDLKVVLDVKNTELTPAEIKILLHARGDFVRLGKKGWRRLQFQLTAEDDEGLARLGLNSRDFSDKPQRLHALQLADAAAAKLLPAERVAEVKRRVSELKTRVVPPIPETIHGDLRPYQVEGFHFLAYLSTNRFGGILADDMGLGKTLQTLAWLAWLRTPADPVLSPESRVSSLTDGGQRSEISDQRSAVSSHPSAAGLGTQDSGLRTSNPNLQTPDPSPRPSHSALSHRPALVVCPKSVMDNWQAEAARFLPGLRVHLWSGRNSATALAACLATTDLLVINYAQLRSLGAALDKVLWQAAILDEGQCIKNPESKTARFARALKAEHRLVLTGTPIENRLLDLWSLMAFAMPGVLGNQNQFAKQFDQAEDPLARRRLAARVRPFLLRRTKNQVAKELPDRVEEDLLCEMEGAQQTLYKAEFKHAQQMLLKVKTRQDFDKNRFNFLTSLLRLRQICCHPVLVDPQAAAAESAKVNALIDVLEPLLDEGHKVLVFSQFVSMIDLLTPVVVKQGWKHFRLTGATENRGALVAEFQKTSGAAVFLISLKAGGFGLNLTAASYVVLFDPWWNPAVENQAIDRTHRIGQTQKVMAYRLLIKDSIEEKIRTLQRTKRALAEDVFGEERFAQSLTLDDLKFLFTGG